MEQLKEIPLTTEEEKSETLVDESPSCSKEKKKQIP